MKLRKLVSVTLALLVVSLLPVSVLAVDNSTDGETIKGPIDANTGSNVTVESTGSVETNKGTIATNEGTVGAYTDDAKTTPDPKTGNFGTVKTNEGTVLINQKNGTVETNKGTVLFNQEKGTVETNAMTGTIGTNKGTVGKEDEDGNVVDGSGNNGVIRVNEGHVLTNNNDSFVITNAEDGIIDTNNGFVGARNDVGDPILDPKDGTGNFGDIGVNNGRITINGEKATVDTNSLIVSINNGKVTTNKGGVVENNGDVGTNYGEVWHNYGKVETNTIDGVVLNETDENGVTGEVKTNYGTIATPNEDGYKVQYGVQVKNTDGGAGTQLLQAVENTILKLAELFQRDGFELVGYEDVTPPPVGEVAEYSLTSDPDTDTDTEFKATRPSILSLIWKAIAKPSGGSDGGDEPTSSGNTGRMNPPVLSSLSADKVSVGALIRCGKVIFKIIEVNDDSIRVATVDTLSQRNQEDMMGYLKQYLSADQIAKFIGQPELLDADEIAQFFKDNKAHIAFYAAKDLFEA